MEYLGGKNNSKKFSLVLNHSNNKITQFLAYFRFILYNKPNFRDIDITKPISLQNEIILFTKLKEIMNLYLSKYPTTLDYDIKYFDKKYTKLYGI